MDNKNQTFQKNMKEKKENPLGTQPVGSLLWQFTIPSIVSMLVSSLYNIVDQFFIGQRIGQLGNAATNIAFPLSMLCMSSALLFGIGGASNFNIHMGKGDKDSAVHYLGNAASMLVIVGLVIACITQLFLEPMLRFFGSPENVLPYALEYTGITSFGFPFFILAVGGGHLIRADGRPKMTMICNLTGAIINTILDAIFVFVLDYGMKGAAWATVIGQITSASLAFFCLSHCKTVALTLADIRPRLFYVTRIASLGAANAFNQLAMMVVQIVMNNSLKYYGALSSYGESIPIACAGIISKVNMIFMSFIIGISQGLQPIASFNFGAGNYDRVKKGYLTAIRCGIIIAIIAFALFQLIPDKIIMIFGKGNETYVSFAVNYFRIFLFFTFLNFLQPISSTFFTSLGKPKNGIFLSLTRQLLFLLPLILIFPRHFGIDGIMYAGPVADLLAALVCGILVLREFARPEYKEKN